MQIKPHSYIPSSTITSIFKGFLASATKICSQKYLRGGGDRISDWYVLQKWTRSIEDENKEKCLNFLDIRDAVE